MAKFWEKVKGVVATVAPTVATALGGPLGGIAATAIRSALGVDTDQQAMEALASDPQAVLKLREAEIEFERFLVESEINLEEINAGDRKSARELVKVTGKAPQVALSVVMLAGYFALLYAMVAGYFEVPEIYTALVAGLIGTLGAGVTQILNFWFGSSSGSKDKTEAMAAQR